ncbi:T9SS type A sorting domain-containing protein [Ulvibacter antarcticus]|uniref:Putative secreted protein (Por secretion system target) n=1 Tax=Ulvibacter antarcticus TaxID=442714 RepID=A0A3L9YVJ8_9FLAO|nr:T9SS type A sorting domain-containing protein [Ulvibacter antarcticus]RMA64543.1 putative secreted protein (Por secretion system target) [Ulvibacter antarcticus]
MKKIILLAISLVLTSIAFAQPVWRALEYAPSGEGRFDDVFFLNESLGWAANGPSGNVYKTTDGGVSWDLKFHTNAYFRNIEFMDENTGFLGTLDGVFYRSSDGGETWGALALPNNPDAICGLDVVDGSIVYGCGAWFSPAYIIKSFDGGSNWDFIDMTSYSNALVEVLFIDENHGYASGSAFSGGIILETTDGGDSWTEIYNSNLPGDYVWKLQLMENNTYIYGSIQSNSQGKLIKSFDSGATWVEKDFPDSSVQAIGFVSPTRGWMGGHNSGFYETNDGGDTWTNISLGYNLNRFQFFNDQLAYCSGDTIYKFEDELSVSEFEQTPTKDIKIVIAPVPVKNKLNIDIYYEHVDNLLIQLYDINGKLLEHLKRDRVADAGIKSYSFDFNYPTGTYVVDFQTNDGRRSYTVVKE